MTRSLLEYAATDKFIMLFLTGNQQAEQTRTNVQTVHAPNFDRDFLGMFENDLGVPDMISCQNPDYNMEEGEAGYALHGERGSKGQPSFSCDKMTLAWYDPKIENGPRYHREDGPATVQFNGFQTFHNMGQRRGFKLESWSFRWYRNTVLTRDSGPHSIQGDRIEASIDSMGKIRTTKEAHLTTSWRHPADGRAIGADRVKEVLKKQRIKTNNMSLSDTVFDNPMDEMAFYSKV